MAHLVPSQASWTEFFLKKLMTKIHSLFQQKALSWVFYWVYNTPLSLCSELQYNDLIDQRSNNLPRDFSVSSEVKTKCL